MFVDVVLDIFYYNLKIDCYWWCKCIFEEYIIVEIWVIYFLFFLKFVRII